MIILFAPAMIAFVVIASVTIKDQFKFSSK